MKETMFNKRRKFFNKKNMIIILILLVLVVVFISIYILNNNPSKKESIGAVPNQDNNEKSIPVININELKGTWIANNESYLNSDISIEVHNTKIKFLEDNNYESITPDFDEKGKFKLSGAEIKFYKNDEDLTNNNFIQVFGEIHGDILILTYPDYPKFVVYTREK